MTKRTIICTAQARLGAMDRIIGAFTHRGFIPNAMTTELQADGRINRVAVSFTCECTHTVEKLVKYLRKQINIIEVEAFTCESAETETVEAANTVASKVATLYTANGSDRVKRVVV